MSLTHRESVTLKTFRSWDFCSDFCYEVEEHDQNRISKLICKICSKHVSAIIAQARIRGISGKSLDSMLAYVDGVNIHHKSNVPRHVKCGSLHDWAKKQFEKESAATGESSESPTTSTNSRATPTFDQLIDQCIGKCSGNPFL